MNPFLAIIIANVIIGMASPIMKMGLEEFPPFLLAFIRFTIATALIAPLAIRKWKHLPYKDLWILILAGVSGVGLHIGLFFLGLQRTQSIVAPIIASSGPVILYIVALLFLKEKFIQKKLIGMIIALAGVVAIVVAPLILNGTEIHHQAALGNGLLFLATIFGVLNAFLLKKVLTKISAWQISFIVFFAGSLFFMPFAVKEYPLWAVADVTIRGWSALLFGIFFVSIGAYTLFHYALTKISAQDVGIFAYMDPVVALIIAWPLLGERPDIYYFLGSLLVFGGIFIAEGRLHWHPFHKLPPSLKLWRARRN